MQTGNPHEIEYRFLHKITGQYRWHLGRGLPVRDADGKVVRWIGTSTDIDHVKRAEAALRDSESRLTSRWTRPKWVSGTGTSGLAAWIGPRSTCVFSVTRKESSRMITRVSAPHTSRRHRRGRSRTALMRESEQKFQWIYRVIWPDGSIHYIEAVGGVVARIEGHAARVIGTAVDITARKLADEELWHARRCLEQRVRNGPRNWKPPTAPLLEGKRLF